LAQGLFALITACFTIAPCYWIHIALVFSRAHNFLHCKHLNIFWQLLSRRWNLC